MSTTPLVVDLRRNALDDGPGIRTTVFFKGCVLDCVWCQNPEALSPRQELQRKDGVCIACRSCERACPQGAVRFDDGARHYDLTKCRLCGTCIDACPPGALRIAGESFTTDELFAKLVEDEPFYRNSCGGVTWSGGEATMHMAYVAELSMRLRDRGIHVLLQTCGLFVPESFEHVLLPYLDAIWFDVKLADPRDHLRYTGADNARIVDNLRRLAKLCPARLLPRVPLVPGVTDTEPNLKGIAELLREAGLRRVALLPYNPLWIPKRLALGLPLRYGHGQFMSRDDLKRCRAVMTREGLETV